MDMTTAEIMKKARAPYAIKVLREHVVSFNGKEGYYRLVGERMRMINDFREANIDDPNVNESLRTILIIQFNHLPEEQQLFEHTVTEAALDSF